MCTPRLHSTLACPLLIRGQQAPIAWLDNVVALQVVKMSIEHAGAPLTLEPKNDYMKRKIEERSLAPNSILNGAEQVCALLLLLHALLEFFSHWTCTHLLSLLCQRVPSKHLLICPSAMRPQFAIS